MNIPNIAIILAGGQGTRLQSITADKIPKVLIPVNGKPVIEHVIENLCLSQIRKIIITTHHLVDAFDLLASGWEQKYRVKIHLLKEPKPLGTGGSIRFARDAINIAKPFVLT